jgi:hypothetical protein
MYKIKDLHLKNLLESYNTALDESVLFEDVSRFKPKNQDNPISNKWLNNPVGFNIDLIQDAMEYGMVLNITYKNGGTRTIYPMAIGDNSKGEEILRAYQVTGDSDSSAGRSVWRLFKTDEIDSMEFDGQFFRVEPRFYNANDKAMSDGILMSVDINDVIQNQKDLLEQ